MQLTSGHHSKIIPTLLWVRPLDRLRVEVAWKSGERAPRTEIVDLAPLINSLKVYKPLRKDRALFETVRLLDDMGDIIVWGDDESIDMDTGTLESLAQDMMTAAAFKAFIYEMDYTQSMAAAMLGYTRRQIANFVSGKSHVPRTCVLACIALRTRKAPATSASQFVLWMQGHDLPHTTRPFELITNSWAMGPVSVRMPRKATQEIKIEPSVAMNDES